MAVDALVDAYTLRARVYPGLLVLVPLVVTYAGAFPAQLTSMTAAVPVLLAAGVLYLLSHIVRQAGKAREPELWRSWGGKPTTVMLRWRTAEPGGLRDLARSKVSRIAPGVDLPTPEEEYADPRGADQRYDAVVSVLREATRSHPVVFAENVAYGFRRNAWAVRPLGALSAGAALLGGAIRVSMLPAATPEAHPLLWVALVVDLLFLGFWLLTVSERWVQQAAEAYARALLAAAAGISGRT